MAAEGTSWDMADPSPDYWGNAHLVDDTRPMDEVLQRLTSSRTYNPRFLPRYEDTMVDDGSGTLVVVQSKEDKYNNAMPKVMGAITGRLSPDIRSDYSSRFLVQRGNTLLWSHIKRFSFLYECGDLDPFTHPKCAPASERTVTPPWSDPFTPIPNRDNCACPEAMYLMPYVNGGMFNPKTGEGSDGMNGGTVENDCLTMYKTVDNTGKWMAFVSSMGLSIPPVRVKLTDTDYMECGAVEREGQSDCFDECVTKGDVVEFDHIEGPLYDSVEPITMRICKRGQPPRTVVRNMPTRLTYNVCFKVKNAEIHCITSQDVAGAYSGFPWCTWYSWGVIRSRYSLGRLKRVTGNNPDGTPETVTMCIPYTVSIGYDSDGCPNITDQGWTDPRQGMNNGEWHPPPFTFFYFELTPESQIPADWLKDDQPTGPGSTYTVQEELYPSVSRSSLQRFRNNKGR